MEMGRAQLTECAGSLVGDVERTPEIAGRVVSGFEYRRGMRGLRLSNSDVAVQYEEKQGNKHVEDLVSCPHVYRSDVADLQFPDF